MVGVYVRFSRVSGRYMRMGRYPTRKEAESSEWAALPGTRFVETEEEKLEPTLEELAFQGLNWWIMTPAAIAETSVRSHQTE